MHGQPAGQVAVRDAQPTGQGGRSSTAAPQGEAAVMDPERLMKVTIAKQESSKGTTPPSSWPAATTKTSSSGPCTSAARSNEICVAATATRRRPAGCWRAADDAVHEGPCFIVAPWLPLTRLQVFVWASKNDVLSLPVGALLLFLSAFLLCQEHLDLFLCSGFFSSLFSS